MSRSPLHSPVPAAPAVRLYRHALESIFAMLELSDLSQILSVSREWSDAVRSMAPISASIARAQFRSTSGKDFRPLPPLASIVASPLLRHLSDIQICHGVDSWTPLDNASLGLLAHHAPYLTSLNSNLTLTPNDPLVLPAKLTALVLTLDKNYSDALINDVLTALATLPLLSRLCLSFRAFDAETDVELSLLAACPSLSDLQLGGLCWLPKLTPSQLAQIRTSLGYLRHFSVGSMGMDQLALLLQPPVTARWQDLGHVRADDRTGELLLRLPSLTKLDLSYLYGTAQAEFLQQLPRLTALRLPHNGAAGNFPADALLASLVRCPGLTEVRISKRFHSAQWSALFAAVRIQKLTLCRGDIDTLRCFASGPITETLVDLTLDDIDLPLSELSHLYALRRLRTLDIRCPRLDDGTLARLSPPSSLLPSLTQLIHQWRTANGEWGHQVQRKGPSYEWMQQRRTQ